MRNGNRSPAPGVERPFPPGPMTVRERRESPFRPLRPEPADGFDGPPEPPAGVRRTAGGDVPALLHVKKFTKLPTGRCHRGSPASATPARRGPLHRIGVRRRKADRSRLDEGDHGNDQARNAGEFGSNGQPWPSRLRLRSPRLRGSQSADRRPAPEPPETQHAEAQENKEAADGPGVDAEHSLSHHAPSRPAPWTCPTRNGLRCRSSLTTPTREQVSAEEGGAAEDPPTRATPTHVYTQTRTLNS